MDQITFSEAEYQTKKRKTRRKIFLERMGKLISWKQLEKKVARYCPKGRVGCPPYPLPTVHRGNSNHGVAVSTAYLWGQLNPVEKNRDNRLRVWFGMPE